MLFFQVIILILYSSSLNSWIRLEQANRPMHRQNHFALALPDKSPEEDRVSTKTSN